MIKIMGSGHPYPQVIKSDPKLDIKVSGIDLGAIAAVGYPEVYISRVGEEFEELIYSATAVRSQTFTFTLDNTFLDKDDGRYMAEFFYADEEIGVDYFEYDKSKTKVELY